MEVELINKKELLEWLDEMIDDNQKIMMDIRGTKDDTFVYSANSHFPTIRYTKEIDEIILKIIGGIRL